MSQSHPDFPGIQIYYAGAGEMPHQGAFYVPKYGDTLSGIALKAYGSGKYIAWRLINMSAWNRVNCTYRESSTRCKAPIVAVGGFLALCLPYPTIWIPDFTTQDEPIGTGPARPLVTPGALPGREVEPEYMEPRYGEPRYEEPGYEELPENGAEVPVAPSDEGIPWWWYLVGAGVLVAGAGYYVYRRRKKR